eukprot:CAMPEP_0204534274 /NCGR_PEP_ID=MMETSP0661-20131031/12834_1 /ASSEMBLY_ACC=CAM_ASM_000606 /TAXON_ID=109239 /ORGANISM="Alexandrium margalefi, Strain AMGDE01CS-322" /LENGTH=381 /DNA_ID=CAMNT_0051540719 /DNA_START=57 /DNA_END=1202 /DNA_ORIENTATION=+
MQFEDQEQPILGNVSEEEIAAAPAPTRRPRAWRIAAAAAGSVAAAALLVLGARTPGLDLMHVAARPQLEGLTEAQDADPCGKLPFFKITGIKSSNLGKKGPDTDQPEGLIYTADVYHAGLQGSMAANSTGSAGSTTTASTTPYVPSTMEIHLNAMSEEYLGHAKDEGANTSSSYLHSGYKPQWPKDNGLKGHFAAVNVRPGTNVTLRVRGFDPATNKTFALPKFAITFFDLDAGYDGNHSVEFVKVGGYEYYYLSNETELKITPGDASTFTATVEGSGDDNPTDPLVLAPQQKNRAVTFYFKHTKEVIFTMGASMGKTARVFPFVLRPIMRCASTKLADGTVVAADSPRSPVKAVRGGSEHAQPRAALVFALVVAAAQRWL